MDTTEHADIDIEQLLAALRPPSIPCEAFDDKDADLHQIRTWKKSFVVSVLAGLSTVPAYHANGIRLDWLQRLVLSKADGQRKPASDELSRALNAGLDRARVLRLEDPTEDIFCDLIATERGNYRIIPGQWEAAAPYTQTLLDAFESLPDSPLKRDTLISVYSLLKLSDAIAARANIDRATASGGEPAGILTVPRTAALKELARRVRLTNGELQRIGIDKDALTPFFLLPEHHPYVSDRVAGETPLEFYPLIADPNGIVVASPVNMSLAVRSVIVGAAQNGGVENVLLHAMLVRQQEYSEVSGFWPVPRLQLSAPNRHFMRAGVCQFEQGRYLHVIQVPATFDEFPQKAFGSVRALGEEASKAIADDVAKFWRFLQTRSDYRSGTTVLLLSGWGTPHSIVPPIREAEAPQGWHYLPLSFADAAVLGACEDGKFRNIVRLLEQVERLEADGFSFQNLNGILNLFGFWRTTDGNLVPEHLSEIAPPCSLAIPTDELLAPRKEACTKRDFRALPMPGGGFKVVQRLDWNDVDDLKPIYASLADAAERRLLGAVHIEGRTWWIECAVRPDGGGDWQYRFWQAVLQWLAAVGADIIAAFPQHFLPGPAKIVIRIPAGREFEQSDLSKLPPADLARSLVGSRDAPDVQRTVEVLPSWMPHLAKPENDAEIELIAATLEQIAEVSNRGVTRTELRQAITKSIRSRDWRWLHAREVFTPLDRLGRSGLVGRFRKIPMSASALVRCGSAWGFRARTDGLEINGETECGDFLTRYRDRVLDNLIAQVRTMDRGKLMTLAAGHYQAARLEQQQWRGTIRALRAIHGTAADTDALKRQSAINAVQRAAKSICEIAACEAPAAGGLDPGRVDIEEMFAKAILLFGNSQLFAAVRAGIMTPTLRISPAGDLLSDRTLHEIALRPAFEWTNKQALDDAAKAYDRVRTEGGSKHTGDKLPWSEELRAAVEAEYGVSAEAFVDLQFAQIQIAEGRGEGAFAVKRSELSRLLGENESYPSDDATNLLRRLTLSRRPSWRDRSSGLTEADFDLTRFDRPYSIINRPLVAMDDDEDPLILVAPVFVSDSTMYALGGLMDGSLNNPFWVSAEATRYAGAAGKAAGDAFEGTVTASIKGLGLEAWPRCKLSWALNEKVPNELGDIDVLAVSQDRRRVWVIEARNLRLCRTEAEVAARLSEYRGRMIRDNKGREKPDRMLRHIRRVEYMRQRRERLCARLKLDAVPEVRGLLVVDAPQPMSFHAVEELPDGECVYLDVIGKHRF